MTTINDIIKEGKTKDMADFYTNPFKAENIKISNEPVLVGGDTTTINKTPDEDNSHKATIESVCDGLKEFLLAKNKNYGNSATEPVRVFSKCNANEGILVRMDDKLSRIKNSDSPALNDTVDLLGYLVLICKSNGWDDFKGMVD